jgi:hypothetical protein
MFIFALYQDTASPAILLLGLTTRSVGHLPFALLADFPECPQQYSNIMPSMPPGVPDVPNKKIVL